MPKQDSKLRNNDPCLHRNSYLENDGISLQPCEVLKDGVDDVKELVPLEEAGAVLLEIVDKVVQDKVGSWTQSVLTLVKNFSTWEQQYSDAV